MKGKAIITGAGGFIGGHLIKFLQTQGYSDIRAVDQKPLDDWYQLHANVENLVMDVQGIDACQFVCKDAEVVYNLAADMGGMGFIENNKALCMLSVLINTHMLMAARDNGVSQFFYASSACVYNGEKQTDSANPGLMESDAYPAMPEDGYGWEKLFSERMCRHFREDFGLHTRYARYHNVYGPYGTWDGGREKAPAAICRKIINAKLTGDNEIEVWGDGLQSRSFMYIDDCIDGTLRLMNSDMREPLNIGSEELVTINQLVDLVADIAGITVTRRHLFDAPQGVRGRNSDNALIRKLLGWEPSISLRSGLEKTYEWICGEMATTR